MVGTASGAETWIPAYRKLFDPDHHLSMGRAVCPRFAWLDLCQMATVQSREVPYGHNLIKLVPGELVASVRTLADRWRWSKSAVSRFLSTLEKRDSIDRVRGTPAGTVYLIANKDLYWLDRDSRRDTTGTPSGTGGGQEGDKNNKYKKENNTTYPSPADAVGGNYPREFEQVWAAYPDCPNKNKKGAYRKWLATVRRGNDPTDLLNGVGRYAKYCAAERKDPQYTKRPTTFFGPDEHWRLDWEPTEARGNTNSEPERHDRYIPGIGE